jgi:hypothetical protein
MFDPQHALLSRLLARTAQRLATPTDDAAAAAAWTEATDALGVTREREPDLAAIVDGRDRAALEKVVAAWNDGSRMLPEQDRNVLHSAIKAFKKSLKLTRLDDESRLGVGAMTGGRQSGIVAISPPGRFAREVFDELVKQGRMRGGRDGLYELLPV